MDTVAGETAVDMEVDTLDARDAQNLALNISDKEFVSKLRVCLLEFCNPNLKL